MTEFRIVGRQCVRTRFLPPTNFKGSRIKAIAEAGAVTLSWDHALDSGRNHAMALAKLCARFNWKGEWVGAWDNKSAEYVWIDVSK